MPARENRIEVRLAVPADAPDIGLMVDAMDTHYRGPGFAPGLDAATAMARRTLEENEGTRFLLAYTDRCISGVACFALLRPGVRHTGLLFLKDLFVLATHRDRGVGRALLSTLAGLARDHDIGRIELNTSIENVAAQRLYDRLGGERQDVVRYKFQTDALAALADLVERSERNIP